MKGDVYSLLVGALLCGAWSTGNAAEPGAFREQRLPSHEAELLKDRLQNADRPRLGIAMSGGGIRSSLFNIGVLKALYDQGVLDDVDIVSSVSGGSYTTYKHLPGGRAVIVDLDPGIIAGDTTAFPEQTIAGVWLNDGPAVYGNTAGNLAFDELDEISASEMLRDLEGLLS